MFYSEGGFKSIRQLAPPLSVVAFNDTNVTINFNVATGGFVSGTDEEPHCALLQLKPTDHSHNWEFNLCAVTRLSINASSFRCQCPHRGTVILLFTSHHIKVLLYIFIHLLDLFLIHCFFPKSKQEVADPLFVVWLVVRMATSSSLLIVMITMIILSVRWFRRRTAWAWFQIQLGFALLPLSSAYLLPPEHAVN